MTAETMRHLPACSHIEVLSALPNLRSGVFRGTNPFPAGHACQKLYFHVFQTIWIVRRLKIMYYGNRRTTFSVRKLIWDISGLWRFYLLQVVFWVTMVDPQRMKKIPSFGNGKFSTFLLSLYNWRFLSSSKERSNLNYFRLNPNKITLLGEKNSLGCLCHRHGTRDMASIHSSSVTPISLSLSLSYWSTESFTDRARQRENLIIFSGLQQIHYLEL